MAKVVDFLEKNIDVVNKLSKVGVVPLSLMQNYDIYNCYKSTAGVPQMKRYGIVSTRLKVSVSSVRKAVVFMEKTTL